MMSIACLTNYSIYMATHMLPIVRYEDRLWFFDARLQQIRPVLPPLEFRDLNDFEMAYCGDLVEKGETEEQPLHA